MQENVLDVQTKAESNAPEDIVWIEGLVPGIDFCNHGNVATIIKSMDNGLHFF